MPTMTNARSPRTLTIYIWANCVVTAFGIVVCLGWTSNAVSVAVGTSLIASGLVGLLLAIIRYFDDVDGDELQKQLKQMQDRAERASGEVRSKLEKIQFNVASLQRGEANRTRVWKRGPTDEIHEELKAIGSEDEITIEVVGHALRNFWDDFNQTLRDRGHVQLHLLMMDPRSLAFREFCKDQRRELPRAAEAILSTTVDVLKFVNQPSANGFRVHVRWDPGFQSVTTTKVGKTIFVRSRILDEVSEADVFFEVYRHDSIEQFCFETFDKLFKGYWQRAVAPTEADVRTVRAKYAATATSGSTGSYLNGT